MFATLELPIRDDSRHKRLKVGRACHPCRQKKIKCDGKQPCMQCKARRRKCMYVKNSDETYIKLDPVSESSPLPDSYFQDISEAVQEQQRRSVADTPEKIFVPDESDTLFANTQCDGVPQESTNPQPTTLPDKMVEQLTDGLVHLTLHHDASRLGNDSVTPWRNYGDFVRWSPEPQLPNYYLASVNMPTRQVQEHLISVFFRHCHHLLPTLSRSMFYDQLHVKGPLITPLLLNAMYAHAAKHTDDPSFRSDPDDPLTQGNLFYYRARRLVDDFLETPRVSTVIALLYLSSFDYETANSEPRTRSSRSWMYCGMAVRMCLELGLHTTNYSSQMSQFDIELRKRVLWTCYVMDKLESCMSERPWMLKAKDISLDFPAPLPEDDNDERCTLEAFAQLCRLMMLVERVIHFFSYETKNKNVWTMEEEQRILQFLDELIQWRDNLPAQLQWTPDSPTSQFQTMVPRSAVVVNLHLACHDLELSLVMCCRFQGELPHRERRRKLANTITHVVSLTVQNQSLMHTFTLSAFSGIYAALTHATDFDHPVLEVQEESKRQFRKSLEAIRAIVERVPVRDMRSFARLVDLTLLPQANTLGLSDVGDDMPRMATSTMTSATYSNAFSAISDLCQKDQSSVHPAMTSANLFAGQQDMAAVVTTTATAALNSIKVFSHSSTVAADPFGMPSPNLSTSTSDRRSPFSNPIVPSQFPFGASSMQPALSASISSSTTTTAAAKAAAAAAVGAVGAPTSGPHKGIEPADYTFELISVTDEWARSLMYQ